MSKENKKTVQVYQQSASLYLECCATHDKLDPEWSILLESVCSFY